MTKNNLKITEIRKKYNLQFIFYIGNNLNPAIKSKKKQEDLFLFSDEVPFYKSKLFQPCTITPIISKIINHEEYIK